jgi:3-phenylpropionate/trans-cinnamate dioxygenase ferredoxin subunit
MAWVKPVMNWWMMYNDTKLDPDQYEFISIGFADEMKNGDRMFVRVDEHSIVIFKIANEIFAIGDVCSHDDGPVGDGELVDHEIHCPRHGAIFDVRTGKVHSLPAVVDIPAYPTRVIDGQIEVGIPK